MDNAVPTNQVPNKMYTALVWYTSHYNHTSGLKSMTIMVQILVPKGNIEWTSGYITDRLFLEMCGTDKKDVIYEGQKNELKINWYYAEAATYARKASVGNFDGENDKYEPIFHLDENDFSPELRANLIERLRPQKNLFIGWYKMLYS